MGTPGFACGPLETLAESDHNLLAVVTVPDKPAGRGCRLSPCEIKLKALDLNLPIYQPEKLRDESFLREMAALEADVFVVVAFRILPQALYSIPRLGSINIHGSLLPKYRGAAPIQHALLNGESETGLTSFFLTKQVDTGDVIDRVSTPIGPDENFTSLSDRLSQLAGPFLLRTLDLITRSDFAPMRQDPSQATPAPKITPEDCLINWGADDSRVHNQIRAFSEKPGAYGFFDDMMLKILGSSRGEFNEVPSLEPGEMYIHGRRLFIGTGGRPLEITRLQPEGKKVMDAKAFLNGYRVQSHQKLQPNRKEVRQ